MSRESSDLPRSWTAALAVFAFAVRAAVALELGRTALFLRPQLDSFEFLLWGQGIAQGVLFQWLAPTHAPGYPFFLGTLLALTGGSLTAVRLAQAALGAGLCVLTAGLAARVLDDRRSGLAAGLLLAVYGPLVYIEVSLLAEGLFLFLLTLALRMAIRPEPVPGATGALLGAAAVVRATALPLLPLLAALTALRPGYSPRWPRWAAVWMLLGWLAVLAPVLVFLRITRGEWLPVQAFGGLNLYMGNRIGSTGTPGARLGGDWDLLVNEPLRLGIEGDAGRERYFLNKTLKEIGEAPAGFLAGLGRKALWLIQDDEVRESHSLYFFKESSRVLRLLPGFGLLFPLAAWGLWLHRRRIPRSVAVHLLVFTASCVVIIMSSRYRLPLVPPLAVYAGGAAVWLVDRLREARWRDLVPATSVLAALAAVPHLIDHTPSHNLAEEWALTASSLQLLGRPDEARAAVEAALQQDESSALAWVQDGRLRAAAGDHAGAESSFRRAVMMAPDYQLARLSLGSELRRKGDLEGALLELRRSLWLVPDDPGTLAELSETFLARKETGEAADTLLRLLRIDPRNLAAWAALAKIEGTEKTLARAEGLFGRGHPAVAGLRVHLKAR